MELMRGQVYSLIAILLTIPVMLFIAFYVTESQNIKYGSLEKVLADQLHEVEVSIQRDYVQAMSISGKRAFLAATDYVIRNGAPLDDASMRIEELMTNGSLYGSPVMIMHNQTIPDWVAKIEALPVGFVVNISYMDPQIENYDGLNAKLTTRLIINVSDYYGIGRIEKDINKEAIFSLTGVEDPIFPLNTLGFVSRSLKEYPYPYHAIKLASGSGFGSCSGRAVFNPGYSGSDKAERILVTDNANGVSGFAGVVGQTFGVPAVSCHIIGTGAGTVNFTSQTLGYADYDILYLDNESGGVWSLPIQEAIDDGYYSYFPSNGGPDMLSRLEEDLSVVPNGMETFVSLSELQDKGVTVKPDQVSLAYLYFSNVTINGQSVRGLSSTFKINAGHGARYNLTELMS